MTIVELAAVGLFAGFTVAINIPQAVRIWRTRDPSGLSISAQLSGVVGYSAWLVYLWEQADWMAWVTTAVATTLWAGITAFAGYKLGINRRQVTHAVIYAAALTLIAAINLHIFGLALSAGTVWTMTPAVIAAWRSPSTVGISTPTWLLYAGEGASWLLWGALTNDPALILYGALAALSGSLIVAAVAVRTDARAPATRPTRDPDPSRPT